MWQIASAASMPNKKILLISPQWWGKMFVAKHHYAVELTKDGSEVYFLNPPDTNRKRFFSVSAVNEYPGLHVVDHATYFPLMIRFHVRSFYDALMKRHVHWLIKKLGVSFDIVWCFEPNLYTNLNWFGARKKIYHPVDELQYDYQLRPGDHADLVISVTREILSKFKNTGAKKLFINHGVSGEFMRAADKYQWVQKSPVVVGYAGNLLRPDIDFATLKKCISQCTDARFLFWGNYKMDNANLDGLQTEDIKDFILFLQQSPNVELKGAVSISKLVEDYAQVDVFLICYDIEKDQSHGTNYHKVMEFLSTGRVIVSNNITTYQGSHLLRMCESRASNLEFPPLLRDTILHIGTYNSEEMQRLRREFAKQNTYQHHITEIEDALFSYQPKPILHG